MHVHVHVQCVCTYDIVCTYCAVCVRLGATPLGPTVCTQAATECAQVRLGVAQAILKECKGTLPWARAGGPFVQSNATVACLRTSYMGQYVVDVWNAWQKRAFARSKEEAKAYAATSHRLSVCSEMMLRPGSGIVRSVS